MLGVYITSVYSVKHPAETKTKNRQMWRCVDVEPCRCVDMGMWMWRCVDGEMCRCEDVKMWTCGNVDV